MAFLTPDKTRNEYGLEVKEKLLPERLKPNRKLSNGTGKAEWVTIHNTPDIKEAAGTNDAEQYARATHNNAMGGVTVHYYIDETDCWQILPENEMGYHAADGKNGTGNTTSLAIEIIMDGSGSKDDRAAEERGALLAAILLHRHGLGVDRIKSHNYWYRQKYCPAYILPHWDAFLKKVGNYLAEIQAEDDEKCYTVQLGAFKSEQGGKDYAAKAVKDGISVKAYREEGYTRVQMRGIATKSEAESIASKARAKGYSAVIIEPAPLLGDVDGDGKVTAADARAILRASVGAEKVDVRAADFDGDGKITASDARAALRKSVGLE